jgi:outer membrane protein assembly factor BamB
MTYWLRGGATWQADSFDRAFQYGASGWVDFAHPVFVPEVAGLEIRGSAQVPQHTTAPYFVVVHYANGVARVSEAIAWDVQPSASADIDAGVLTAGAFEHDRQPLTVHALFTSSGVQHRASRNVLGRLTRGVGAQNAWPTYQADARHTGYVPNAYDPETFSLRWEAVVRSGFPLNPVTGAEGRVFASIVQYFDSGPSLFALDAKDGELIWSRDFGEVFSVNPPAWAHGNVYVQTGSGSGGWLHAFDAASGTRFLRAPFEAQFERYYAPVLEDGSAYVNAGTYGGMYAFDAFSGRREWSAGLSQYDEWTPAIMGDTAYAFLGRSVFYSAGLYVLDRHSGQRRRFIPDPNFVWAGWSMRSAPVILDDRDVIAVHDGRVLRFDVGGENVAWEHLDQYVGQPTVARGTIHVINGDHVEALDLSSGTELWRWTPPPGEGGPTGTMIVTDSHLFVSTTVAVHAVDLSTQESSWSYPAAGWIALADDNLYIARADGTLTALLAAPDRRAKPPSSRPFSGRSRR